MLIQWIVKLETRTFIETAKEHELKDNRDVLKVIFWANITDSKIMGVSKLIMVSKSMQIIALSSSSRHFLDGANHNQEALNYRIY